jgi:hypothetical protein
MPKVTYLFGAGASCECLPIVTGIPDKLDLLADMIEGNRNNISPRGRPFAECPKDTFEIEEEMMKECRDLAKQSRLHASIDTYAKKLMITEEERPQVKYTILKTLLSLSFIREQLLNNTDSRYDSFFASILGTGYADINQEIRIVSWNYDFQFEKAFSLYSKSNDLHENQRTLKVFPSKLDHEAPRDDGFCIFKINGTTAFKDGKEVVSPFKNFDQPNHFSLVEDFVYRYARCIYKSGMSKPMLSFCWERAAYHSLVNAARDSIQDSKALVVIGYSFPYFNRPIDKFLMETFAGEKIYVQDINPEKVIRSLHSVLPTTKLETTIEPIKVQPELKEQFYLPPEL